MYPRPGKGKAPASGPHRPMSIDAMLDMERQEVLALLENKKQQAAPNQSPERERRSVSPYAAMPRSPVRSMLDIDEEPAKPSPPRQVVRSMLDMDSPLPPSSKAAGSSTTPNSPVTSTSSGLKPITSQPVHHRSQSDAQFTEPNFGPRLPANKGSDVTSGYQFSNIYSASSGYQAGKKSLGGNSSINSGKKPSNASLGEALRNELGNLQLPGDKARHSSISTMGGRFGKGTKSKSPHNRLNDRSRSPATFSPQLAPGKAYLNDGRVMDLNSAYRRLSDANLISSSGSLAQLPMRKQSGDPGEGRLIKDYLGPDGEHLDSSEEDEPYSSDDEDRGRKKDPRALNPDDKLDDSDKSRSRSNQRKTLSLMAAAEEERTQVASKQPKYQYRSLIPEPEIKITSTSGDTVKASKHLVHPHTSYDHSPGSATPSAIDSDEEQEVDEIKRAQKMSFTMTNILANTEANRAIRIIYRGEYNKIAQVAEEENRRLRKYLVATDLSDESTHALEWAIGTVLRDGDTLIAIYCVDEDTGIVTGDGTSLAEDSKAMKDQAAMINSVMNSKTAPAPMNPVTDSKRFHFRGDSGSTPGSSPGPAGRDEWNKAAYERSRAVQDITDRVLKLLRKTQLQVRVIVEVLHCKNPKHLITEVIDLVDPTLVVIGSRGRSALKGVILGSFSNYLVTKSSVPVMVARKRLRKQSKYKQKAVRQVNNLSNPIARSLANAKID